MAKRYFRIFDKGDNWEITDCMFIPDGTDIDITLEGYDLNGIEVKDIETFEYVKSLLDKGHILLSKDYDGEVVKDDIIFNEFPELYKHKKYYLNRGKDFISKRINVADLFDFIDFILCNNRLMNMGYHIVPDNPDDVLNEIIDNVDMKLHSATERFIEARDRILTKQKLYISYRRYEKEVMESEDLKGLQDAWKRFVFICG